MLRRTFVFLSTAVLLSAGVVFGADNAARFLGNVDPSSYGCSLTITGQDGYVFASQYQDEKWIYRIDVDGSDISLQKEDDGVFFPNEDGASSTMKFTAQDITAVLKVTYIGNEGEGTDSYQPSYRGTLDVRAGTRKQIADVTGTCGS